MEPSVHTATTSPRVAPGTFMRGFLNGAGSGAVMMGIFYTGMLTVGLLFPALHLVTFGAPLIAAFGIGVMSTGVFSGLNASKRAYDDLRSASNVSGEAARAPVRAPESHDRSPGDAVDHTLEQQRRWTESVGRTQGRSQVSDIIANGSMSDKDRASAILAAREQSAHAETSR